jgi:hypothetical protein
MATTNARALHSIVGRELRSVEFVRDYVQLHFDGPTITAVTDPVVTVGEKQYERTTLGYRDVLCDRIGRTVRMAVVEEDERIVLEFDDKTCLIVSLREEDYRGPEAVIFQNGPQDTWVW